MIREPQDAQARSHASNPAHQPATGPLQAGYTAAGIGEMTILDARKSGVYPL